MCDLQESMATALNKEDQDRALQSNLHKALDLERRLNTTNSNTNETNILRASLCGTLADILLLNADVAHAENVVGRLWRHCFYARIAPTRARLTKLAAKQGTAAEYKKRKEGLQEFLQEGVDLYKYLQAKLREQLVESTQSTSGLVPCLHRCTIHLGDLYRYAELTPLATDCYTTAAALAPGSGHPWNQVAVAATQGTTTDRVLDTVYWYVRALGASVDPFPTAQANCQRIVSMYQKTTQNQQPNTGGVVLAGKSTRLFLGQLVCEIVASANDEAEKDDDAQHNRRLELVQQFQQLLQAGIFSDALVLKLMCILLYYNKNNQGLLLPIAAAIAARCHSLVASKVTKAIPCNGCRGLVVLTVVAEYFLLYMKSDEDKDTYRQPHAFWKDLVATYNLLHSTQSGSPETTPPNPLPERQELRGFLRPATLYVKDAEAASLLQAADTDAASVANTSTTTESEGVARNRTAHFLQLPLDEHLDFVERQPDGKLNYAAVEEEEDEEMIATDDETEDFQLNDFMPSVDPQPAASPVVPLMATGTSPSLVYKTTGNGPALLVPTMLTAAPTPTPAPAASPIAPVAAAHVTSVAPAAPTPPSAANPLGALLGPSRLPPPPGFGSTPPHAANSMPALLGTTWAQQQSVVTDNPFAQSYTTFAPQEQQQQQQQQHQQSQFNDNRLLRNLLLGESSQSPFAG